MPRTASRGAPRLRIETPPHLRLAEAAAGRWLPLLPPHRFEKESGRLRMVLPAGAAAAALSLREAGAGALEVEPDAAAPPAPRLLPQLRAALRLDEDLSLLYALTDQDPTLRFARERGAGRLLRSPTAFEDLVKALLVGRLGRARAAVLCEALCRHLGPAAPGGARAFPGPAEMSAAPPSFYTRRLQAGPLAVPLRLLAQRCSEDLHAEALRGGPRLPPARTPLPQKDLAELLAQGLEWEERLEALLLSLPGFGLRAAELLLPLLGCYDVLLYSGRLRGALERLRGEEAGAGRRLQQRLLRYGPLRGLALLLHAAAPAATRARPSGPSRSRKNQV